MDATKWIDTYIEGIDWRIKENANSSFSHSGMQFHISQKACALWWFRNLPPFAYELHEKGIIHIHDLGMITMYCVGWDLKKLVEEGLYIPGRMRSKPPKHFSTALRQMANFVFVSSQEHAGACAFSDVDEILAPLVRKDGLTYREVKQHVQEFVYTINTPGRAGYQSVFFNLTFNGKGGEEGHLIRKAFFEVLSEGDAEGRPFTFPIITVNGAMLPEIECEEMWELSSKFTSPYFQNGIYSNGFYSMCCRLSLDKNKIGKKLSKGGNFAIRPLTGSVAVVTINLAAIASMSSSKEGFFGVLEKIAEMSAQILEARRRIIEDLFEKGLFPFLKENLKEIKRQQGRYTAQHFSTIGVCGGHEACLTLGYEKGIEDPDAVEFMRSILYALNEMNEEFENRFGNLFNLEATPSESASFRMARKSKEEFGNRIKLSGEPGIWYLTNSTQLPPYTSLDLWEQIRHQEKLQTLYSGGTVFHIYLGEEISPSSARKLITKVLDITTLPYVTLSPVFTFCSDCGKRTPGINVECPFCGSRNVDVYTKVVGYLSPFSRYNPGKRKEHMERKLIAVDGNIFSRSPLRPKIIPLVKT